MKQYDYLVVGSGLYGAVFAFYNQSGQVMEIAESGENGYFKILI